ncbi:MAG: KamA family radical SAM protein [Candidatus Omnitrophica bacterium]|nr:KamA family radical SAM protein [Candidatus Omnitrophota bacterium]MBU4590094.1 KamA family radical SAM protein [Candidatus Omnitrophota bacterium]
METETEQVSLENDQPPGCSREKNDWRRQLRNSIKDIEGLKKAFSLNAAEVDCLAAAISNYPFRITPYYLSLIDRQNPEDPVRLQCVPSKYEERLYLELQDDPLGEEKDTVVKGLVHRYPDRVLVGLTDICPVYCRHCTRKREWHKGFWTRTASELEDIYAYISDHKEIRDVILSGGDPFILSTEKLEAILKRLRGMSHVEIIRIGTRCPVVLPQRIDDELVSMLKKYRPIWLNTHFNHPNEITPESARACDRILCAGIPVNNQTVLLKGINDDAAIMTKLCQGLLRMGVRPYYLFQCDPVTGTGHFRTSIDKGLEIIKAMRGFTSGLCVPTYVIDGLEGQGKVPLQPEYLVSREKDHFVFKSYKGELFKYHNPEGQR